MMFKKSLFFVIASFLVLSCKNDKDLKDSKNSSEYRVNRENIVFASQIIDDFVEFSIVNDSKDPYRTRFSYLVKVSLVLDNKEVAHSTIDLRDSHTGVLVVKNVPKSIESGFLKVTYPRSQFVIPVETKCGKNKKMIKGRLYACKVFEDKEKPAVKSTSIQLLNGRFSILVEDHSDLSKSVCVTNSQMLENLLIEFKCSIKCRDGAGSGKRSHKCEGQITPADFLSTKLIKVIDVEITDSFNNFTRSQLTVSQ